MKKKITNNQEKYGLGTRRYKNGTHQTIVFNLCRFATFFYGKLSSLESFVHRDISLHLDFREYEGNLWLLALLLESVFKSLVPLILQKKSHPLLCAIMPGITQDNGNWPSSLLLFMTLKVNPLLIITTLFVNWCQLKCCLVQVLKLCLNDSRATVGVDEEF